MIRSERALELAAHRSASTDAPDVIRILVEAFRDDPMWGEWAFPVAKTRRQNREAVFRVLVEAAMVHGWVWLTADRGAAAVWVPPGRSELSPAQERKVDAVIRGSLGDRADAVLDAFEMFEAARPVEPHYYLTLLGTDPSHMGKGIGRGLLLSNLENIDEHGAAAYLEASDELVPLYERYGFRPVVRIELEGAPTVNGMWRASPWRR